MTAPTYESPVRAPLPTATFVTSVARVQRPDALFVRVTFAGGDLERFRSVGPDQFVYLLLPPSGRDDLTIDSSFGWDQYRAMPEEERPVGAYYTVRHHRPEVAELDIDVLVHATPGLASSWAAGVQPGAPAALWGPRTAFAPPAGTTRFLLLGDETAIPAAGAILEALSDGDEARVVLEIDAPEHERHFESRARVDVSWLHRRGLEAGRTSLLLEAGRGLDVPLEGAYVWAGGEVHAMNQLRAHFRGERGLPTASTSLVGYWRHEAHRHIEDS